jgi:hypothetical protein
MRRQIRMSYRPVVVLLAPASAHWEAMMPKQLFLTPYQDITLNLVFWAIKERRYNRTTADWISIAARLPPFKALLHMVNALLRCMHEKSKETGIPLPLIRRFQAGDERYEFEDYPRKISRETLRLALTISGMRTPRRRAKSF